jgi:hypothetical protein
MLRPTGHLGVLAGSAITYAAIGWADQQGWLSVGGEAVLAAGATPMAFLIGYIFFREWHEAIGQAEPRAESVAGPTGDLLTQVRSMFRRTTGGR